MALTFRKVEGLGNDFLLIDRTGSTPEALQAELPALREAAPKLCDRRTGVGGDGLLIVGPPDGDTDGSMIVVNHDGSRPEMCGNGLRCVAQHLANRSGKTELVIQTDAGAKPCSVGGSGDACCKGTVVPALLRPEGAIPPPVPKLAAQNRLGSMEIHTPW